MNRIKVMPKHVSELIAAGEVVERPSSVVKELMENAIDAGASSITVEIKNGGATYIRVTDDGSGIPKEDVKTAFLRHATSKIQKQEDLDTIGTLGFRGEALASISSVSRIELLTRVEDAEFGIRYLIEGGAEKAFEEVGTMKGTTIIIHDLFYNVPARMKFLKSDTTEANAVAGIVDRIALSHPDVSVCFIRDGKQRLLTPGNNDMLSTIYAVLGQNIAETLIPVDYTLEGIRVTGYVSKPIAARGSRSMQFFFLNGRFVRTGTGVAALENAYRNTTMVGKFPACVLNIKVPFEAVDVNVHPAKIEVRFINEKPVYQAVYYAVKSAIAKHDTRPSVHFETKEENVQNGTNQVTTTQPKTVVQPEKSETFWQTVPVKKKDTQPKQVVVSDNLQAASAVKEEDIKSTLTDFYQKAEKIEDSKKEVEHEVLTTKTQEKTENQYEQITHIDNTPKINVIGEAFQTYTLVQVDNKILIIDKHAAHERMIFNALKSNTEIYSQLLLEPLTITMQKDEYALILENIELLSKAGFTVEDFGMGTILVRACPSYLTAEDVEPTLTELATYLAQHQRAVIDEKLEWLFDSVACRSAIKAGSDMSLYEMQHFVEKLLSDDSIRYCPHGRPVYIEMSKKELEKNFGRI